MGTTLGILHVEYEAPVTELVRQRLRDAGVPFELDTATNGAQFREKWQPEHYDVVILNSSLPDMTASAALRLIRARDQDTTVIVLFETLDGESINACLRHGASDYVLKNTMQRLAPAVQRALREKVRRHAHHKTMTALQETTTRLADLAVNLPGGLYQFLRQPDGRYAIPWCSESFENITGVRAELIKDDAGPAFAQIIAEDLPGVIQSIEESASRMHKWDHVFRITTPGGVPCWLRGISRPRRLADGAIIWNGVLIDISEQKSQEQELLQYRDHLQARVEQRTAIVKQQAQIIDQIQGAVISADINGVITSWNQGAHRLLGFSAEEMLGRPLKTLCTDGEAFCQPAEQALKQRAGVEAELTLVRRNGAAFTASLSLSPLKGFAEEMIGIVAYVRDISAVKQAEAALQNSEARYRAVVETAVDGIITIDDRGTIETFNQAAEAIFGYRGAEVIGKNITSLMPPTYAAHHQNYVDAYLHSGVTHVIGAQREVNGLHRDGTVFPMQLSVSEMRVDNTRKFTGVVRNVSQVKNAEEALLSSERFSRNILNSLSDHIAVLDKNGVIVQVNDAWEEFARLNQADSCDLGIGANYLTVCRAGSDYADDHAARAFEGIQSVLKKERPMFAMEYPCHSPRRQRWFLMSVVPLLGEAGGAVVAHMNITERVLTELALQQSEYHLKEAQRIGRIGHWRWRAASGELQWSEEIYRIFGRDPRDFAPTYERFLSLVHPEDLEHIKASEQRAFAEGKPHSIDHRILLPDGGVRWVHEEAIAVLDEYGQPVSLTGTVQDISERKEIENQLRIAKNEAEQASRAKSEFLSSMSHELRTPLNAIIGYTQLMLMDESFNPEQMKSIAEIDKAGDHLVTLINDLLDLAKIEAGRVPLTQENLPLTEILEECQHLVLPTAERRGISLSCDYGERPDAEVHADRVRLKQVILNVLSNAVKYNRDHGQVRIAVQPAGDFLRLSIADSGKGILPQHMHKLFKAFNRLDADSSGVEGTGIGLVIAKNLIELMGGRIQVDSVPDEGTTFRIDIPTEVLSCKIGSSAQTEQPRIVGADAAPCTILYIEDNPANLRLVQQVMKRRPAIRVISATTGPRGLETALAEIPDLVLLDISLPGMDGYEVLARLRGNQTTAHIPVIAVSANAMSKDIEQGLNAGFCHYITKPIDIIRLLKTVDQTLSLNPGTA